MIDKLIQFGDRVALEEKVNEIIDYLNHWEERQVEYINKLWDTPVEEFNRKYKVPGTINQRLNQLGGDDGREK